MDAFLHAIQTWVGPTGMIFAVIVGAFYCVGRWMDANMTPTARAAFVKYLIEPEKSEHRYYVPAGTDALFKGIFGDNHFSVKCLKRSTIFTFAVFVMITAMAALHDRGSRNDLLSSLLHPNDDDGRGRFFYGWVLSVFVLDYLNLGKTRFALSTLSKWRVRFSFLLMSVIADTVAYFLIFCCFAFVVCLISDYKVQGNSLGFTIWIMFRDLRNGDPLTTAFFLAGYVPTLWLLMTALATALIKLAEAGPTLFRSLRNLFSVERAPASLVSATAGLLCAFTYASVHGLYAWVQL